MSEPAAVRVIAASIDIGVGHVLPMPDGYRWLNADRPVRRIGTSIRLYRIP